MQRHALPAFRADSLDGLNVHGADGDLVGEVEAITRKGDQLYLIVSGDSFLGIGDQEVPVKFDNLKGRDNRIMLKNMTEEQFEEQPDWEANEFQTIEGTRTIRNLYIGEA